MLTVEVLMSNAVSLAGHRLTLLSACGSMLSGIGQAAEEFVGLPTGWLQAGSPAVIASLWPVRDDATLLLVQRFHELWAPDGTGRYPSPASALRLAQRWLRQVTMGELRRCFAEMEIIDPATGERQRGLDLGRPLRPSGHHMMSWRAGARVRCRLRRMTRMPAPPMMMSGAAAGTGCRDTGGDLGQQPGGRGARPPPGGSTAEGITGGGDHPARGPGHPAGPA